MKQFFCGGELAAASLAENTAVHHDRPRPSFDCGSCPLCTLCRGMFVRELKRDCFKTAQKLKTSWRPFFRRLHDGCYSVDKCSSQFERKTLTHFALHIFFRHLLLDLHSWWDPARLLLHHAVRMPRRKRLNEIVKTCASSKLAAGADCPGGRRSRSSSPLKRARKKTSSFPSASRLCLLLDRMASKEVS